MRALYVESKVRWHLYPSNGIVVVRLSTIQASQSNGSCWPACARCVGAARPVAVLGDDDVQEIHDSHQGGRHDRARIPTPEQEDERRVHRELERLRQERTAHSNRIRSLLVLHNLRVERIGGRAWAHWWAQQAGQLLPGLRTEIEREFERLSLVARQIRTLEAQQKQQVRSGAQPVIAVLSRLAGIGTGSAWTLVKELFGWRQFHNRREVAGCLGLAPTPYASGTSEVEQGISKAGNKRVRWLMVELAWSWLRFQPGSQLSQWFNERFAGGGKRMRRIGIVALARRLSIALWRYLEQGEIPRGATLKPHGGNTVAS